MPKANLLTSYVGQLPRFIRPVGFGVVWRERVDRRPPKLNSREDTTDTAIGYSISQVRIRGPSFLKNIVIESGRRLC